MLKLTDIKGERSFDVLADLVNPVANIAADPDAAELFGRRALPEGMTVKEYVLHRLRKAMPVLLKKHKKDVIKILSLLSDMSEKEYKEQITFEGVLTDMSDLMTDPIFNAFFTTQQSMDESFGSASENTAE